jgi:hypothetical protein
MGADFNELYPYDSCTIGVLPDPSDPDPGWGYDRVSGEAIRVDEAADFMTYQSPKWSSEYRWDLLVNKLQDRSAPFASPASLAAPGGAAASVSDVLAIYGTISADESSGGFLSAYHVPTGLSVPSTNSANTGTSGSFALEFYDGSSNLLQTTPVNPTQPHAGEDVSGGYFFFATDSYPVGTASIRLMRNQIEMLAELTPSANPPVVSIDTPTPGAVFDGSLQVSWTANDPDGGPLRYIVQYRVDTNSPWTVVASQLDQEFLVLSDSSELPGSSEAEIRVIASDGLNMGWDEVGPFELKNHPPDPIIFYPLEGAAHAVGTPVVLEGRGLDPEEGPLGDASLSWTLNGPTHVVGNGAQLRFDDLPPGTYTAKLKATDSQGKVGSSASTFVVSTKAMPDGQPPTLDGRCEDETYTQDSEPIQLRYGAEGTSAVARFVRKDDTLYGCIDGLEQPSNPPDHAVWLYFDADDSGDATVQPGDFGVGLWESGLVQSASGSNGDYSPDPVPTGADAGGSVQADSWSAEFAIDVARLGGWDHFARLRVVHEDYGGGPDTGWPLNGDTTAPSSYGRVALGQQSQNIQFPQLADQDVHAVAIPSGAGSNSGLPIVLVSLSPSICDTTLSGEIVLLGVGTCTLEAQQPGNPSYAAASPVMQSFQVNDATAPPPVPSYSGWSLALLGLVLLAVGLRLRPRRPKIASPHT